MYAQDGFKFASMEEMDVSGNGKLVAFRLSIWHYKVAFDGFWSQNGMVTLHEGLMLEGLGGDSIYRLRA